MEPDPVVEEPLDKGIIYKVLKQYIYNKEKFKEIMNDVKRDKFHAYQKKYREDHTERLKEKREQYKAKQKERYQERKKAGLIVIKVEHCNACDKDYKETNRRAHNSSKYHKLKSEIYEANKKIKNLEVV